MRNTALILNSITAVFFTGFLAYTFFARQHLDQLARGFVTEKTLLYSKPLVDAAETTLNTPLVSKLLSDDQIATLRGEITNYRTDPSAYVSDLTGKRVPDPWMKNENILLGKAASIKRDIRAYYDETLASLVNDLRIFAASNLVAASIAIWLAYRSTQRVQQSVVWFSFLIFAAIAYCSYMYVDDMTFFRILFRTHMGWSYPVVLCIFTVVLFLDFGRIPHATARKDASAIPDGPDADDDSTTATE